MTDRLRKIFDVLPCCHIFADIGCDHGYIAFKMISSGKCDKVIVSDISEKCLLKAENLLSPYIDDGRCESVVSDGFDNIKYCDLALIAGMGGEEIISILERAEKLPEKLVLQPMKNCDKVRCLALKLGYKFDSDKVFFSGGKFYNLIALSKGTDSLTKEEIEFGRDNLRTYNPDFVKMIVEKIAKLRKILLNSNLSIKDKNNIVLKIEKLKKYEKNR